MSKLKINIGRKKLSSEYIASKQNFDAVLKGMKSSRVSILKNPLFYGTVGMASLATVIGIYFYQNQTELHETKITKNEVIQSASTNETLPEKGLEKVTEIVSDVEQEVSIAKEITTVAKEHKKEVKQVEKSTKNTSIVPVKEDVAAVTPIHEAKSEKKFVKTSMPSISGVYNGTITWDSFKNGEIFIGEGAKITHFSIQYTTRLGDKTMSVQGNKIPDEVKADLEKLGLNQTVFITNLVGTTENNEVLRFVSMELALKFK